MARTVEEMRKGLIKTLVDAWGGHNAAAIFLADSLIAAAREEGKNELQAIFDMLWKRMRTWEEEWRSENPKERALTSPDSIQLMEWKIAKARAEGAEQERERIRNANGVLRLENDDAHAVWVTAGEYFILPASLLAPTEPEVKP